MSNLGLSLVSCIAIIAGFKVAARRLSSVVLLRIPLMLSWIIFRCFGLGGV